MPTDFLFLLVVIIAAGLFAGFIAGLFGVGGGVVLVPVGYYAFRFAGVPEDVCAHLAVATSLATMIPTSLRSMAAHRKAGAVDEEILRGWLPWIALGAAGGAVAASQVSGGTLLMVFGVLALLVAGNMAFGSDRWRVADAMPKGAAEAGVAGTVGFLSAMMGIGGGAFGVTIMTLCGRAIHQAVATASGFGWAIAAPATVVNITAGWGQAGLPPASLGYVNGVAFVLLAGLSLVTAPIGAGLAHRLDRVLLKRLFAAFLAVMALNLIREALSP